MNHMAWFNVWDFFSPWETISQLSAMRASSAEKLTFLTPDTDTYVCVSWGYKC